MGRANTNYTNGAYRFAEWPFYGTFIGVISQPIGDPTRSPQHHTSADFLIADVQIGNGFGILSALAG